MKNQKVRQCEDKQYGRSLFCASDYISCSLCSFLQYNKEETKHKTLGNGEAQINY